MLRVYSANLSSRAHYSINFGKVTSYFKEIIMARILVVEDNNNIRILMTTLFQKRGHEIVEASNGLEALQMLVHDANFDIMVTDMEMPTLNGSKLIETVKVYYPNIYIVAMSAYGAYLEDAHETGADSIIHKPFSYHTLVDIIDGIAAKHVSQKSKR
jgi:CheY-like chemotaxis protein